VGSEIHLTSKGAGLTARHRVKCPLSGSFLWTRAGIVTLLAILILLPVGHAQSGEIDIYHASGYTLANLRLLTANYTYTLTGAEAACSLAIHAFDSFPYLKVAGAISVSIIPYRTPITSEQVDELGNRVFTVRFTCSQGQKFTVTVLEYMMITEIVFNIDPSKVGEYDKASPIYRAYTASSKYIESDNPEIVAASKRIIGSETNPYFQARKIYDFVRNIRFDSSLAKWNPATEGALYILRAGRGVCRHHAALFVALCRAAGIPAAEILGIWGEKGPVNHSWVHFYLANYGWIPAEPTPGACFNENENSCFAGLDNRHTPLISVNYQYWVYSCKGCEAEDAFFRDGGTSHGPVVTEGVPEDITFPKDQTIQSMTTAAAIDRANASIRTALAEGRTESLDNASSLLLNASSAFEKGDYDTALALAQQAKEAADSATYPQAYYEARDLLLKAMDLRSRASAENFTCPEAEQLVRQAESAYSLAATAFVNDDYAAATHHAQTAILLFEEALSVEQNYPASLEAQQRQAFNYALIGVVSGITLAVLAIYTARKRTKKSRPRAT